MQYAKLNKFNSWSQQLFFLSPFFCSHPERLRGGGPEQASDSGPGGGAGLWKLHEQGPAGERLRIQGFQPEQDRRHQVEHRQVGNRGGLEPCCSSHDLSLRLCFTKQKYFKTWLGFKLLKLKQVSWTKAVKDCSRPQLLQSAVVFKQWFQVQNKCNFPSTSQLLLI